MSVIRLDTTAKKLQATMASTHSTSQPECIVCFYDMIAQSDQTIFSLARSRTTTPIAQRRDDMIAFTAPRGCGTGCGRGCDF